MSEETPFSLVSEPDGVALGIPVGRHTAGSGPQADLRLCAPGVDAVHLVFTATRSRCYCQVRSPGQLFGHNGKQATGSVLQPGDRLGVGGAQYRVQGNPEEPVAGGMPSSEVVHARGDQATLDHHYQQWRRGAESEERVRHMDVIFRLAQLVAAVDTPRRFGEDLLDLVLEVLPATRAFLLAFTQDGAVEVLAARPELTADDAPPGLAGGPSATIMERVRSEGISLITDDASHDPRLESSESIIAESICTAICAPIWSGDELLGAIYADSKDCERTPSDAHLNLLEAIASYAGAALGRARLYEALQQRELHTHLLVHDMKNPLASIHGGLDLLEMTSPGGLDADEIKELIRRAAERLEGYITDILNTARLEHSLGSLQREEVDLEQLVQRLQQRWEPTLRFSNHRLEAEVRPPGARFAMDRRLVSRVLDNLLDNAIQHSPLRAAISVTVTLAEGALEVQVKDRGPGVPEEARERIFEKFGRAAVKDSGGRGFGLYYCRLAVEAHGGRLEVRGGAGDNRFVFTLAEAPAAGPTEP